jgi:dTDP-4-dehydrorhamnose 3,5-epimerase
MTKPGTARQGFEKIDAGLEGVVLLRPTVFRDSRGQFFESYHEAKFAALGIRDRFVQDNQSRSVRRTLRGLHYQLKRPQAKLCRVVHGEVLDVAVDIRLGSPNFGKWTGAVLSGENGLQIYIPAGFAHGFLVLSESAEFLYKCSDFYDSDDERGIRWNDPALGIGWNEDAPLLSTRDSALPLLSELSAEFLPRYETTNL